jgi:integrase
VRQQTIELLKDKLFEGRLSLERKNGKPTIYWRAYLNGRVIRRSTGETTEGAAKKVASEAFLKELAKAHAGDLPALPVKGKVGVLFETAYESFQAHVDRVEEVSPLHRQQYRWKWSVLKPHFDGVTLPQIDTTWLEDLRKKRKASKELADDGHGRTRARTKPLSNVTIKKDLTFVRLVLRHAVERDKTLARLPHFPSFRGTKWKAKHKKRPYLPPEMWRRVKKAAFARIHQPASTNVGTAARIKTYRQELYAFLMICVGGALRVDEARGLTWADCELGTLNGTECVRVWLRSSKRKETEDERLRGWLLYDGVRGWKYLRKLRPNAKPDNKLFLSTHVDEMKNLLEACGVREEEVTGMLRNARSLRSTGLSLRLDEGPDPAYNDLSQWARTSPQQLMNFYIQLHPDKAVGRIIGFRGDEKDERPRARKSQILKELPSSERMLNRHRRQTRIDEMKDNDDVYGVGPDDDVIEEPAPTSAKLRLVAGKKR